MTITGRLFLMLFASNDAVDQEISARDSVQTAYEQESLNEQERNFLLGCIQWCLQNNRSPEEFVAMWLQVVRPRVCRDYSLNSLTFWCVVNAKAWLLQRALEDFVSAVSNFREGTSGTSQFQEILELRELVG